MAIIEFGPAIAEARGKIAGQVFSRNAAGPYIRAKASPVQPRTTPQQNVRAAMTYLSQYWRDTLTAAQRAAWNSYAAATPLINRFNKKMNVSGLAMFLRFNTWWRVDGGSVLAAAPSTPGEAPMISGTLEATVANGFRCTAVSPSIAASDRVIVQVALSPTSQARNYYGGPWTQNTAWGSATAFPQNIIATVSIGQRLWCRLRYYDNIGKVGPFWQGHADCTA